MRHTTEIDKRLCVEVEGPLVRAFGELGAAGADRRGVARHLLPDGASGGERRRVEIARALAANPKYLLLDEPFAGVDPISVGDIRNLLAKLKNRGLGVLITDHNVRETLEIVDRAYILHDGAVLMSGTPQDVVSNEHVRRVYLGDNFKIV